MTRRGKKSKLRKSLVKKAKKERKKEEKKSNPEVDRSDVKTSSAIFFIAHAMSISMKWCRGDDQRPSC
jgi:hypothetical protein